MRVVLDTNVLVSAVLKDKSMPAMAVRLAERRGTILKSEATERQLFDVLARPYFMSLVDAAAYAWLEKLMRSAESVAIRERIKACRDATDDKFLELAANGRASVIVSGDADLLVLDPFRGIPILPASGFVQAAIK